MAPQPPDPLSTEPGQDRQAPLDDAPTPRRGTRTTRMRVHLGRVTRGLSRRHWSGARLVVIVLLLTALVLLLFLAAKGLRA